MKNVVIISSSPRKNSNSETLAGEFLRGAKDGGNAVECICLRDYNLGYCRGCFACAGTGKCVQKDGMNDLADKLIHADVLVFATPVYFYSMSGQMKVFLDRFVPFYTKVRADIYIMVTAADTDEKLLMQAVEAIRGCTRDCLEGCPEKGVLMVGGVSDVGDIAGRPELARAYALGRDC